MQLQGETLENVEEDEGEHNEDDGNDSGSVESDDRLLDQAPASLKKTSQPQSDILEIKEENGNDSGSVEGDDLLDQAPAFSKKKSQPQPDIVETKSNPTPSKPGIAHNCDYIAIVLY